MEIQNLLSIYEMFRRLSKLYIQASNLMKILSIFIPTTLVLDKIVLSSQRQEHLILFKMGQRHKNLRYNH